MGNKINSIINYIYKAITHVFNIGAIYVLWVFIHYLSSLLYHQWCAPASIIGFILSPLLITSPHCKALLWCINTGHEIINIMWVSIGTYGISKLLGAI
tara:strand:- start:398 stop:691 length:294 start_codon:yes stop_codon:yes gene_type:complete